MRQLLGFTREAKSEITVETADSTVRKIIETNEILFRRLLPIASIGFKAFAGDADPKSGQGVRTLSDRCRILMAAPNANVAAELAKAEKLLAQLRGRRETLSTQIRGDTYAARVPAQVQEKNRQKMENLQAEIENLEQSINALRK